MRRVVVTGATGSLGQRVARLLLEGPRAPTVIGVDLEPAAAPPPGLVQVTADLAASSVPDLVRTMEGASAVIHLAWRTPDELHQTKADETDAQVTNLVALRNVQRAAELAGVRHLIHLSSATVYGAWPDNPVPLGETAPLRPNPEFAFAVSKAEAERTVGAWTERHPDVTVTVLRPTVTVGSPTRPLYQALAGTRSPGHDDGGRIVQFLHVDDLASAVVTVWAGGLAGVFNVAPDAGISDDTARALAGGVARVALPSRLAQSVSVWSWNLWRLGSPREAQAYMRWPWVVAPDRLLATGWAPEHSSEEALVATDDRAHWDDLPPGRRQNLTVLAAAGSLAAAAGVVAGLVASRTRRRRARPWWRR